MTASSPDLLFVAPYPSSSDQPKAENCLKAFPPDQDVDHLLTFIAQAPNMSDDKNKTINLHSISSTVFLRDLRKINSIRLGRATQSYLICKSTILRRKAEIKERQSLGDDYADLQRMVVRLETSMRAHKAIVDELSPNNGGT